MYVASAELVNVLAGAVTGTVDASDELLDVPAHADNAIMDGSTKINGRMQKGYPSLQLWVRGKCLSSRGQGI